MQSIRFKALAENPGFLIAMFKDLAQETHLVLNSEAHERLVGLGIEAAKAGDVPALRSVIGQMFANRISTGADANEIVALADLLGG